MQGSAMTTTEARATPFTLLVALSAAGDASGSLVLDDGEQPEIKPANGGKTTVIQYRAASGGLSSTVDFNAYPGASAIMIDTVRVLGDSKTSSMHKSPCASVSVEGSSKRKFGSDFVKVTLTNDVSEIVIGPGLDIPVASTFKLSWTDCEVRSVHARAVNCAR